MTSISSIDTSIYSGLFQALETASVRNTEESANLQSTKSARVDASPVDLSNYYSNLTRRDLLSQVSENVVQASQDLDNAMINALENGMTVNDACNIKLAQAAYKASCLMLKSTFELSI